MTLLISVPLDVEIILVKFFFDIGTQSSQYNKIYNYFHSNKSPINRNFFIFKDFIRKPLY